MGNMHKRLYFLKLTGMATSVLVILILMGLASGCSGVKNMFTPSTYGVTFYFESEPETNDGQPMYVLLRIVNKKDFIIESYDQIANMVFDDSPKQNLLAWQLVIPGETTKVRIDRPEKVLVAVYALFTRPGEKWKVIFGEPFEKKYNIVLLENELQ